MKAQLTARTTEYRGIRYRSKCEAMFAMWLNLEHGDTSVIEYEPDWCEIGDYVPDFTVAIPDAGYPQSRAPVFRTYIHFIEYKPSRPTFTYLSDVSEKLRQVIERECHSLKTVSVGGFIYYGSVFTEDRGIFNVIPTGGVTERISVNWIGKYEKQIRDYRFDLESEA